MSHSNKKKKKIIKSDKTDLFKNISKEPSSEALNINQNEYSLFNKKNIDLILSTNSDEEEDILKKDKQKEKNKQNYNFIFKCISSPNECHSIPLIMIDSNQNIISSQCPANGHSNEITNPHQINEVTEMSIHEYLKIVESYNSIKCSNCQKKYSHNNNKEEYFFFCYNCSKYFCKKCKEEHIRQNNKDEQLSEKHYILNIENLPCYCLYHNEKNFGYCQYCKQNICVKCAKTKIHNSHDIVLFKNILINSKEVSEIKKKINIEKKNWNHFESIFLENLKKLKAVFYKLLEKKKEISKLKENLINEYEKKSYNYQIIMTCLNMEFNSNINTLLSKNSEENCLNVINFIFDTLKDKKITNFKKTQFDSFDQEKENNHDDSSNENINKISYKEKESKEELRAKKLKKKKINKKIFSNSFNDVKESNSKANNNSKEEVQVHAKRDSYDNAPLSNSNIININNKNPIRVKINNSILNNIKENKEKVDISRNIFNKKLLISNNLTNKSIKEEKSKEEENEDDLLFFPKKNSKSRDQITNKSVQSKKLGEGMINSDEIRGTLMERKLENEKMKSPKFKKNKINKMKGNDILDDLILEDAKNKVELFNSLKIQKNFNKDLFEEEKEKIILKSNNNNNNTIENKTKENNIKENNKETNNIKENENINTIEPKKKIEVDDISNSTDNINNLNKSKLSVRRSLKKKDKKKLIIMKNELHSSSEDNLNSNQKITAEKELNSIKPIKTEKESLSTIKNKNIPNENAHISNPKLNIFTLNNSGDLVPKKNQKISNIKIYKKRAKTKTNEYILPPPKYSQDNIQNSSTEKEKKNLTLSAFKEMMSNDENEDTISENYSDNDDENDESLSLNSLLKIKNKNKFEKKSNKIIKVKKNFIENPNNSINENKEISLENSKVKKDKKGRIYSIKIKNDPVWCVLSMKNNEYLSVGFASGIIRIFNQNEFTQKMSIEEHTGAIYSMYLTKKNSNCFLTSSTDKLIKKILISDDFSHYTVISTLKGHNSSVYKAIELNSNQILSCSDDGCLIIWENINKNEEKKNEEDEKIKEINKSMNSKNNNNSHSSNYNKLNFINDFLNVNNDNDNDNDSSNNKANISNKYLINKKLNQNLNKEEIIYDILQINHDLFVSSSLYGYLRFWEINSLTNSTTIKDIQCNDSHNCLCIINKTIIAVLLNEKYGLALVDYIKKEVSHKIIIDKDIEIKLSAILLTTNKLVVIGGQNNSSKEENQVVYKFYKIIKVKKLNSNNFKYSLKFLTAHIKKAQKILPDDDIWLNAMTEGNNGTIINGLGSTYMNKEYGQIYIFFREIKNKNLKDINKDSKINLNESNKKKNNK